MKLSAKKYIFKIPLYNETGEPERQFRTYCTRITADRVETDRFIFTRIHSGVFSVETFGTPYFGISIVTTMYASIGVFGHMYAESEARSAGFFWSYMGRVQPCRSQFRSLCAGFP